MIGTCWPPRAHCEVRAHLVAATAAGRFGHIVECARVLRPLRSPPQPHLQGIRSMQ